MRTIAVDGHVLSGIPQGSRTYLANILDCLGRLDRRNRYQIFSFDPTTVAAKLDFPQFEHHAIALRPAIPRLLFFWPYAKLRYKFDALVTQYILPPLVPGPHFVVTHDILPETHPQLFPPFMRWRSRLLFRLSAQRARAVFVVSNYTRGELIARYRVPPEKVHLTYNGFRHDCDARVGGEHGDGRGGGEDGNFVLYVGRLERRKNVDLIIRALDRVPVGDLRLIIVGGDEFASPELLHLIRTSPRVEHRRNVDDRALDRLYRSARALVYPSSAEGFGLPILEALSRGVPVIASDRTALPEVGGPFARYFDPTAQDGIERLTALLAEAGTMPPTVDPAALSAHLSQFDWERSARVILDCIEELP
jgi:glycosyltransferase involved in cell wall biosynthesis